MTERDDSSKGFLERWSHKKIDAEREAAAPAKKDFQKVSPAADIGPLEPHTESDVTDKAASKPEFDLATLPSLESITAVTDIRAFLTPGVPAELACAALRRAWTADPAIRDFKGLAENDWDFTDPTAMPGFGPLPPGTDIKKMLAQIFGEGEKPLSVDDDTEKPVAPEVPDIAEQIAAPESAIEGVSAPEEKLEPRTEEMETGGQQLTQDEFVQSSNNIAPHNSSSNDELEEPKHRRRHGGALPQ